MGVGIGASIVTITDGTTAHASDVLTSLNNINNAGVSNDGGTISTSGAGVLTVVGLITGSGHIVIPNNVTLQIKDAGGTARDVLYVDAANETCIQLAVNSGGLKIKDSSGATIVHFDNLGNANFKAAVNQNVSNP